MKKKSVLFKVDYYRIIFSLLSLAVIVSLVGCTLPIGLLGPPPTSTTGPSPTLAEAPITEVQPTNTPEPVAPTEEPPTAEPPTSTAEPTATTIGHLTKPENFTRFGVPYYDVDSSGTGLKHYAPFGDVYNLNRFERPFSQTDMTYQPYLDIQKFNLVPYGEWNYAFIKTIGHVPKDGTAGNYGIEIDLNRDGFGDYLIFAKGPLTTTWSTDGVSVLFDGNHDTAGINPNLSEAPLATDGYETVIVENGIGNDPDLAWARISPEDGSVVQVAFKVGITQGTFMWGPIIDAGLKSPGMYNYNDQITEREAGSPVKDNLYYPIKDL